MPLLTPTNLYYIISISITSRLLVLLIQVVANFLLEEHNADAYRNRYHLALTNNISSFDLPDIYVNTYKLIEGFTKWDSQYFLEISLDGYATEEHLAFLPMYPTIINFVRQILFEHNRIDLVAILPVARKYQPEQPISTVALVNYIRSAVIGYTLNNFIFFPLATVSLFALTKLVKRKGDKYAKNVVWWFCFNPASIFFSACYTESLFAALTFTGIFLIEYQADNYLNQNQDLNQQSQNFKPLYHLNRLLQIYLPCLAFFALASATRSNGTVNVGFLLFQFLLKYKPLTKLNFNYWSFMMYLTLILEFLQDCLVVFMSGVLAISGYITFQVYSYIKFCSNRPASSEKGTLLIVPEWCQDRIPHPYARAQEKYWMIGAFEYYQFKQVPNFLLALPITHIVFSGTLQKKEDIRTRRETDKKQLAYYVQSMVLIIMCSIYVHVQVTTRLLTASCPVVYWILVDTSRNSRKRKAFNILYCGIYFFIGSILHTNYYPWT